MSLVPRTSAGRTFWRKPVAAAAAALALSVVVAGCGDAKQKTSPTAAEASPGDGCITHFDPNTDYFPVKQTLQFAENFTLTYDKSYEVLTVKQPFQGGKPESYVLVKCGAPKPTLTGDLASAQQITVPVHSLYSGSTTHLPALNDLGAMDVLTGVADGSTVSSPEALARISSGKTVSYAPGGQINTEQVVTAHPDVLLTDGTDDPAYGPLRAAGVHVVADADWLENTPLGRAEWMKFIAAFTGDEAKATSVFGNIVQDYQAVAAKLKGAAPVKVLPGQMYQGTWSIPGGGSYAGKLIEDAGGTYPWQNAADTGSQSVNFEQVYAQDADAAVWISSSTWRTESDVLKDDSRYGTFAAFRNHAVWAPDLAVNSSGGNDYWERGVERPDLVLSDLAAILHPDLMPNHQFTFYRQVTP